MLACEAQKTCFASSLLPCSRTPTHHSPLTANSGNLRPTFLVNENIPVLAKVPTAQIPMKRPSRIAPLPVRRGDCHIACSGKMLMLDLRNKLPHLATILALSLAASGPALAQNFAPQARPAMAINQGFVPGHARGESRATYTAPVVGHMHSAGYEDQVLSEAPMEGEVAHGHEHGCDQCGGSGCEACADSCCMGFFPLFKSTMQRFEFFSGVMSFSGPANRGETGSFGYTSGFNLGSEFLFGCQGLGYQAGMRGNMSNFNGASFTPDDRTQVFATAGLFRRVDWGLQGGLVFDYLHDEWNYSVDLTQLRGELSWVVPEGHEFGFWFTVGASEHQGTTTIERNTQIPVDVTEDWDVTNLNALFYRRTFGGGAQARMFAGWTGQSDGLLGGDVLLPLSQDWMLQSGFTYLIPEQGPRDLGYVEESWNLSVQLVWYPCGRCAGDYYRPLFNVADNGSFMVDRR